MDEDRLEEQFDLLTAALLGVALGVGATMLLRRGPAGHRPIGPMMRAAGRGAKAAGRGGAAGLMLAGARGAKGARWAGEQAGDLWDRVPVDEIQDRLGDYFESARDTIEDAVESELNDLRKSIRRQRKRLGL